jgi:hypothetical protein
VRRRACFLGPGRAARACTRCSGGSARRVECRIPAPLPAVGVRFPSSSSFGCVVASGAAAWSIWGRRGASAGRGFGCVRPGRQDSDSRGARVLDLRPTEERFKEEKVKGVAAFRFSEGCRILEGRKTSKSAVRFVWPASRVDRGSVVSGDGRVTFRGRGRDLARVGERSPGAVFGRQRLGVGSVLLERRG